MILKSSLSVALALSMASLSHAGGFVIDLVTTEKNGITNPIDLTFDDAGRIWTIPHISQTPATTSSFLTAPEESLIKHLTGPSTWEKKAAWHQIADRQTNSILVKTSKTTLPSSIAMGGTHERQFERFLARKAMKQYPAKLKNWLNSENTKGLPKPNILCALQPLDESTFTELFAEASTKLKGNPAMGQGLFQMCLSCHRHHRKRQNLHP